VLEVLNKYSGTGFNQEDVQLMSSIAAQAAIAVENSRLYEEIRDQRDHIILTQDDARRELTRKLQDGPMQLLSAISMSLEHLERLSINANPQVVQNEIGALHNLVHQARRATHGMLLDARPLALETEGLVAALNQYVSQLQISENFNIHFKATNKAQYNTKVNGTIYSIVQEAIHNIRRHANAENVWLTLDNNNSGFTVTIRDNGQGFHISAIDSPEDNHATFGIKNMREQAESIGATLQIDSGTDMPNRGTIVQLNLPWPPQKEDAQ
jgi:signal transduction histidine kinase